MTFSSLGTPCMHGSHISRLPAFDAFQRGFTNCFHAFSNLLQDSFWPTLLCLTQILCSFLPFPFGALTSERCFFTSTELLYFACQPAQLFWYFWQMPCNCSELLLQQFWRITCHLQVLYTFGCLSHFIIVFLHFMNIYFRKLNTATTTLAITAPKATLGLTTLWSLSHHGWLALLM